MQQPTRASSNNGSSVPRPDTTPEGQKRQSHSLPCCDYISQVRACFSRYVHAGSYYEQLISYISIGHNQGYSPLQVPKIFFLGPDRRKIGELVPVAPKQSEQCYYHLVLRSPSPATPLTPAPSQPHITVVEGFLAPESVSMLGGLYGFRPELFIGHLELYGSPSHDALAEQKHYEYPSLPSSMDNIIHVRFVSMLRVRRQEKPRANRLRQRLDIENKRTIYESRLFGQRQYGAARFRALHVHNDDIVTVEQMVTFSVSEGHNGWHGLFLLDSGRTCSTIDLPWIDFLKDESGQASFIPVVPYNLPPVPEESSRHLEEVERHQHPYHPARDIISASQADASLLKGDPFYICSCLYRQAALARLQLLNFIESDIAECSRIEPEQQTLSLQQLRFNFQLVRRVERFCKEDLRNIERYGSASWPRRAPAAELKRTRDLLQDDYAYLIEQCVSLQVQCETASQMLVSMAQLAEARKGIRQSRQVTSLTMLAFIFVPLTYVSTVFGMNVDSLDAGVGIWVWATASCVSVAVTVGLLAALRWVGLL